MCQETWFDKLAARIEQTIAAFAHRSAIARSEATAQLTEQLRSLHATPAPVLPRSASVWRSGTLLGVRTDEAVNVVGNHPGRVAVVLQNISSATVLWVAPTKQDAETKGATALRLAAGASVTIDTTAAVWVIAAGASADLTWFATETRQ